MTYFTGSNSPTRPTREDSELADGGKECPVPPTSETSRPAAETPSLLGSSHSKAKW